VLAAEKSDPERRAIRVAAAKGLRGIIAQYQIAEAAKAVADNYNTFFDLCGTPLRVLVGTVQHNIVCDVLTREAMQGCRLWRRRQLTR
jgi:hypothetical protein